MAQLNETSGVITSPFYPRRYPNNQDCNWQITAKKGSHVKLEFDDMDIFGCINCGTCDFLDIQNGYTSDGSATGKHCSNPGVIYSVVDSLKVRFFSDGRNEMQTKGFKATYTLLSFTPPGKRQPISDSYKLVSEKCFTDTCNHSGFHFR